MTILTTHGGVLGHYHLLDLKYVAVAAVDDNAVFVIEGYVLRKALKLS